MIWTIRLISMMVCAGASGQKEEVARRKQDQKAKARYELENMFTSVNRVTYGNITMFSPVLCEKDLFNNLR